MAKIAQEVAKESVSLQSESIIKLRSLFPECFSEGKLDFAKLKRALGDIVESGDEKYSFNWSGRADSFRNIQSTSKGTLVPSKDESVAFDSSENLFVEGDNLEVLKLLQKSYFEKVKVVYIDPPYNTGNDFLYKDNFQNSIESYLQLTGQSQNGIKLTTNPETSGRFHSDWLSMIYPRLFIARNLLHDTGLIFVSIDDKEIHNLRIIMNEIFGEENFVVTIIWKKRSEAPNDQVIGSTHEYIVCYAKNLDSMSIYRQERSKEQLDRYKNPDNHPKGPWTAGDLMANVKGGRYVKSLYFPIVNPNTGEKHYPSSGGNWRFNKEKIESLIANNEIYFGENGKGRPKLKRFLSEVREGVPFPTLWDDGLYSKRGTAEIAEIFGSVNVFDTPKPVGLIKKILELATSPASGDIVLDFFAGSCTTAQATLEKNSEDEGNRRFICIQLPEALEGNTEASKDGYKTIADIGKERIRRVIKKISKEAKTKDKVTDLGFKVFKLSASNYRIWENIEGKDLQRLKDQIRLFKSPLVSGYRDIDVIYEVAIKEGFSLNCKIEKVDIQANKIYRVTDDGRGSFIITLDSAVKDSSIDKLQLDDETMFVCLDDALDDSKKTNLAKQCILKTI